MAKKLFLSLLVIIGLALFVLVLYRLLRPEKPVYTITEVERVFPGGETIFVESRGLRDVWDLLKGSDYYREKGYAPLLTLPVLDELSREIGEIEEDIGRDINFDVVMHLLGLESGVGFYMGESDKGEFDYLVVSRVYPEILFMERLATFFAGERYVTESKYRGLKVKEIVIDKDAEEGRDIHKIVYTIDGDLLILTGKRDLFNTAADRHLDGGRGGLTKDERFISARGKVYDLDRRGEKPCIFGFVDSKGMRDTPIASKALAKMESYLSCDLLLFSAHIDGDGRVGDDFNPSKIVVGLETKGGRSRSPGGSKGGFSAGGFLKSEIADDELILVKANDLSLLPEAVLKGSSPTKEILLSALFNLFFDGFTAAIVQKDGRCPALAAWGKSPPGAMKIITEVAEKNGWAVVEKETGDLKSYSVVETETLGPELMVIAFHGDDLFMADDTDLLKALINRVKLKESAGKSIRLPLKEAVFSRSGGREGGLSLTVRPGPVWESMKTCPSGFDLLSARLYPSSEDDVPLLKRCRFIKGLYPIREVVVGISPADGGIKAEININIDADAKGGGTR